MNHNGWTMSPSVLFAPCILLVEDDVLVRAALAEYLRECGYEILEAVDANEARQLLALGGKSVGLILADADGDGGFGLAGWVRANHPGVEVVLTGSTAKAAEKAGDLCREGPARVVPYDHSLLLDRIRRLSAARDRGMRVMEE